MLKMDLKSLGLEAAADRIVSGLEDLASALRSLNDTRLPETKGQLYHKMAMAVLSHQTELPEGFDALVDHVWNCQKG